MNSLTELKSESVVAVVDSREQRPLDLSPMRVVTDTLPTGDYSVRYLERIVAIERKSVSDLLGCVGSQRVRFEREVQRLRAYPVRAIVVEATWTLIEAGDWRSAVTPQAALGSLLGWVADGVPVVMAGDRTRAAQLVRRLLCIAARRRYREARRLLEEHG